MQEQYDEICGLSTIFRICFHKCQLLVASTLVQEKNCQLDGSCLILGKIKKNMSSTQRNWELLPV